MTDRKLFVFWFGDEMSSDRTACLKSIQKNSNVDVELINEKNLNQWSNDLHQGFEYLSSTHKSDYLRSYFMFHYGGGYTDIKRCEFDWNPYFKMLEESSYDFIGYHEVNKNDICIQELRHSFLSIAGPTQFIFKKNSNFAKEWFFETNKKLDNIFDVLKDNPGTYHPRAETNGVQGEKGLYKGSLYPLKWNDLLGKIFHQLSFNNIGKYSTDMPYPNIENYR